MLADASTSTTTQTAISLKRYTQERMPERWYTWAMDNYKSTVLDVIRTFGCRNVLEIGGGRSPLLTRAEVEALGVTYTVNDISERELELAPDWTRKTCFDFAGESIPEGDFDLVFSRMVMEHVRDASRAYRNQYRLLRPGGIGMHFHPTLFAPPFVVNYLLPDRVSRKVLEVLGRRVTELTDDYPKFPAYYSWCRNSPAVRRRIEAMGFSDVEVVPFYGHGYFRKIPGVRQVDDGLSGLGLRRGIGALSSYAYTLVRR